MIIAIRRLTQQSRHYVSINVTFDVNGALDSDLRLNIQLILDRDAALVFDRFIRLHRRLDGGDLGLCPHVSETCAGDLMSRTVIGPRIARGASPEICN